MVLIDAMDYCIAGLIFDRILLDPCISGLLDPLLADMLGFLDHLLGPINFLQVFIVVSDVVGAVVEAFVLLEVLKNVEAVEGLLLAGEEGVDALHVLLPHS